MQTRLFPYDKLALLRDEAEWLKLLNSDSAALRTRTIRESPCHMIEGASTRRCRETYWVGIEGWFDEKVVAQSTASIKDRAAVFRVVC